jgi:hypothetical protein
MDNALIEPGTPGGHALARFLRTFSAAALEFAQELETAPAGQVRLSLTDIGLGSLQRQIAEVPQMATDEGISPRLVAQHLGRADEPNVRSALDRMRGRGVTELAPGPGPQRWRLTTAYR